MRVARGALGGGHSVGGRGIVVNRTVWWLCLSQACLVTTLSVAVTAFPLISGGLAPHGGIASLPLALLFLVATLVLFPAARVVAIHGRRPLFIASATCGALGCLLGAGAVHLHQYGLFLLAAALLGIFIGIGQAYRFAAMEVVAPSQQGQAISLTLAGGIFAAILGPNLARTTRDMGSDPFAVTFLVLAVLALCSIALAWAMRCAPPSSVAPGLARSAPRQLMTQSGARVALGGALVAWTVMTLLMTATPMAMTARGHSFAHTAMTMQWHMLAMFLPSLVSGRGVHQFGAVPLLATGALVGLAGLAVSQLGASVLVFQVGLVLVGIAWNFMYVASTALLSASHQTQDKVAAQGLNDALSMGCVTIAAFSSSPLLVAFGWAGSNLLMALPLVAVLVASAWLWRRNTQMARLEMRAT